MKKVWMSMLAILLVAVTAVTFVACSKEEDKGGASKVNPKDPKKDVSVYNSGSGYETINDPLTWEAIDAFPIAKDGMTIEEGRKLVVDFFRFAKTALWMPSDTYTYMIKSSSTKEETLEGFVPYGGLPYISVSSGNIYRLMDYMDPETHVVDMATAGLKKTLFGNQCSFGSYVGAGRVINSARYSWTKNMTLPNGFLKVGDYKMDETVETYNDGVYNTVTILEENGMDAMFESYAGLKHGDVIVYFTTAGHVVMISGDAVVVRGADGKIDPKQSYVTVIDQTPTHGQSKNEAGDNFNYEKNVDAKWDFMKLWNGKYVPFTFKEWTGEDPIETSWTKYSHEGETITLEQIFTSTVTSNYGIYDIYAKIYNANGVEVAKLAVRAGETSLKELKFIPTGYNLDTWGDLDSIDPSKYEYTVKITANISTGERPVLWEGKLAK